MNSRKRNQRGFERVGAVRAKELGLPQRKTQELTLASRWRKAAGGAVADRVVRVRVARGTLEVHLDPLHASWATTIVELLPQIAGRLARDHPGLRLRRARLLAEPPVPPFADVVVSAARDSGLSPPSDPASRLRELARRYLERTQKP